MQDNVCLLSIERVCLLSLIWFNYWYFTFDFLILERKRNLLLMVFYLNFSLFLSFSGLITGGWCSFPDWYSLTAEFLMLPIYWDPQVYINFVYTVLNGKHHRRSCNYNIFKFHWFTSIIIQWIIPLSLCSFTPE